MTVVAEIKTGDLLVIRGDVCKTIEAVKETDGRYRLKMFNFTNGSEFFEVSDGETSVEKSSYESYEFVLKEKKTDSLVFQSGSGEEQVEVPVSVLGENVKLLRNDETVFIKYVSGLIADIELPKIVVQIVESTEDIEKDNTRTEFIKEAKLLNGKSIIVPAFIKNGDKIKIHLDTGEYICRD
ncbi:MAG: hypothetical protein JXN63_07620 [Candidatus Delongbacteria bacterium]|nr:hypothetical protein [Candidatus Delongbacteria bacterium]